MKDRTTTSRSFAGALLPPKRWQTSEKATPKTITYCEQVINDPVYHFARARKMVGPIATRKQSGKDSRHHFARARNPIMAIIYCGLSGIDPSHHFAGAGKMITLGAA
jgi:hypothetical protein